MDDPFLSIVIPAYNEALRIRKSLESVRSYLEAKSFASELIVVDDGSTDNMAQVLEDVARSWPALRVLRHAPNRGKGYSVREGVLAARGRFVVFADADLSAPIEQADRLIAALESTGADAAVGSRALERALIGIHQPWFREWAGRLFNLFVRLFTGLGIHDTQCGLKAFRRETTRRSFELQRVEGFGFDPEVLFLIKRQGGSILEIPVCWNDDRASKVRLWRDSIRMLGELIALRWRVCTGRYPRAPGSRGSPHPLADGREH